VATRRLVAWVATRRLVAWVATRRLVAWVATRRVATRRLVAPSCCRWSRGWRRAGCGRLEQDHNSREA